MRFLIVGTGGVGGLYGARLVRAGHDVTFIARGKNLAALRRKGLRVKSLRSDFRVKVRAVPKPPKRKTFDVILICVKSYETPAVLKPLKRAVHPQSLVLSLQNGVTQHEPLVRLFGRARVARGMTYVGVHLEGPGVVRHVAAGRITLGALAGKPSPALRALAQVLNQAGIPSRIAANIEQRQWEKLMWNIGFNGPTAILDVNLGDLLKRAEQRVLVESLMKETIAVAGARGIRLSKALPKKLMRDSARHSPFVETSMLWDRRRGHRLEWEIFQGFLSGQGRRLNIPTPANDFVGRVLRAFDDAARR